MNQSKIEDMGKYSVSRTAKASTTSTMWVDDLRLGWCEPEGAAHVQVVYDYVDAEARLVLRRGAAERVLTTGLEQGYARSLVVAMFQGDEVVLQWRAAPSKLVGRSEVAEMCLREHVLCR